MDKFILKLIWNCKKHRFFNKEEESYNINTPWFQTYDKAIVIKAVWYWHKQIYRPMEQKLEPTNKYLHLWPNDFWQVCQILRSVVIQWRVKNLFNEWCGDNSNIHMQINKVGSLVHLIKFDHRPKCKSKKYKTLEKMKEIFLTWLGNGVLDMKP